MSADEKASGYISTGSECTCNLDFIHVSLKCLMNFDRDMSELIFTSINLIYNCNHYERQKIDNFPKFRVIPAHKDCMCISFNEINKIINNYIGINDIYMNSTFILSNDFISPYVHSELSNHNSESNLLKKPEYFLLGPLNKSKIFN